MKKLLSALGIVFLLAACSNNAEEVELEQYEETPEVQEEEAQPEAALTEEETAGTSGTYVIQTGDTLSHIAEMHGVTVAQLSWWNWIMDANDIQAGRTIDVTGPELPVFSGVAPAVYRAVSEAGELMTEGLVFEVDDEETTAVWSPSFLNGTDMEATFLAFIEDGGRKGDALGFATFATWNAPVMENWQEVATADILAATGDLDVEYFEFTQTDDTGDIYTAYMTVQGTFRTRTVPLANINSRTGEITWDFDWTPAE